MDLEDSLMDVDISMLKNDSVCDITMREMDEGWKVEDNNNSPNPSKVKQKAPDEKTMPDVAMNIPDVIMITSDIHGNENIHGMENHILSDTPDKSDPRNDAIFRLVDPLCNSSSSFVVQKDQHSKTKIDSNTKLELEQVEQELDLLRRDCADLKLKISQKDVIIKNIQENNEKMETEHKKGVKQLLDKIAHEEDLKDEVSSLKKERACLQTEKAQLVNEVDTNVRNEFELKKVIDGYERTCRKIVSEHDKIHREHDTTKRHLDTLQMAFSDVHTKYQRSKDIIYGYDNNEKVLLRRLEDTNEDCKHLESKYELLKAHVITQLEKANILWHEQRQRQEEEINKMMGKKRCSEIKYTATKESLDQLNKQCSELTALLSEVTSRR